MIGNIIGKVTSLENGIRVTFPSVENAVSYKLKRIESVNINSINIGSKVLVSIINNNLKDSVIIGVIV